MAVDHEFEARRALEAFARAKRRRGYRDLWEVAKRKAALTGG